MIDPLSWLKLVSPLRILTLAGLLLGGLGTTAGAGEIPFAPAQTIDGGFDGAISVAAGDLDGDGIPELVGAAGLDGDISFWRNTAGDGSTWTETLVDGSFAGVKSVALANLDSRTGGSIDILAVSSDTIRIWRNTSNDGSAWMTRDVSTAATFPGPADAVPADIDGTGGLDVVGVSAAGVSWWFNRFAIGQIWDKNDIDITGGMPSSVAAADLDGDGDTDVIVTFYDGDEVAWYENTAGNGTAWTRRSVATLFDGAQSVSAADLDGDGDIDLAGAALIGNEVTWWENTLGDGTAWTQRVIDSTVDDASSVEARDMDGDGDLDLLGTASAFGEIQWFDNVAGDGSAWVTRDLPGTFFGAADAIALDVDDDGDQDVVGAALGADEIAWWENTSIHRSAAYPVGSPIASSLGNVRSVHGADVDGDGDRDLLVAIEDAGEVLWWENGAGDGSVWTEHTIDAAYAGASGVYAGDLDGDGDLDVYATSATQNNGVWWENLAGDGSSWGARFQIFSGQFRPSNPQIVDIDADGTLDVMAVMTDLFRITFWRNLDGDGTNWFQSIAQGNYREARSAHATDIDGDGDADIATAASFFNTVSFVRNGLSLGYQVNIVDDTFTDAFSTFAADLDNDGDVDILAAGRSTGEIAWWENTTGDGDFGPRITLATGFVGVTRVAAADLDGDGDNDVYGTSSTGNQLVWWENVGDGSAWTQRTVDDALSLAAPVIAADPDGDGKLDLVAAGGGGDLGWWRNLGGEFALPTADVAQPLVADGSSTAVLRLDAAHRGRAGDSAVELATVEILLESTPGTPMTDAEAGALLDRLSLYADDGSGEFESGNDTEIASQSSFTLDAGALTLTIDDDQALAQVAFGAPRSFFVVPTFEVAASATMLDGFRFTHLTQSQMVGASSSGEDAANDLPLTLEFSANVSSGPIGFNAAPVAQDDAVLLLEDQVAAGNVLDGTAGGLDTDPNGTALAAILVTPPSQGVLLTGLAADGGFQYEPNGNFVGVDSFTYRADDGLASSKLATVTLTVAAVNDPPSFSITPQHLSSEDAAPQTVPAFAFGIAPGPADEGGQAVTFTITGFSDSSLFATLPAIAPDGTLTYEAAGDAVGTSTMTVRLTDDGGTANGGVDQSAEQSFDIVIQGVNDAPSFTLPLGESRTSEDGGAQSLPGFATEILAGPEDETGQTLTFSVTGNTNPALFAVPPALAPDGTLTYTSAVDGNGAATITVLLMDDGGTAGGGIDQSGPKSFDIVVEPVNDPPSFTLTSLTPSLEDGGPRTVPGFASSILPGPSDESGQGVQFLVTDNSNPDLFAVPPSLSADGTLTYASAPDANGTASVTVVLMDDGGTAGGGVDQSAEQSFDIEVTPVNDKPSFAVPSTSEVEATPTPQTVVGFATQISAGPADESGQALQFQILGNSAPELFAAGPELAADGTLTFTLIAGASDVSATVDAALMDDGGTDFGGLDTSGVLAFELIVPDAVAPRVTSVTTPTGPLETCTEVRRSFLELGVIFSETMAFDDDPSEPASVLNPENYRLIASGPDRDVTTSSCGPVDGDDLRIVPASVTPEPLRTDGVVVELPATLGDGLYKLLVCDTLEDAAGNPLAETFQAAFRVSSENLFAGGQVDCDLGDWQIAAGVEEAAGLDEGGGEVLYSPEDVDNAGLSGSIRVVTLQNTDFAIGQCLDIVGSSYDLEARVRVEGLSGTEVAVDLACQRFPQPDCTGAALGESSSRFVLTPTDGAWQLLEHVAEGATSAICGVDLHLTAGTGFEAFVDGISATSRLFSDGFESGDTDAWSQVRP